MGVVADLRGVGSDVSVGRRNDAEWEGMRVPWEDEMNSRVSQGDGAVWHGGRRSAAAHCPSE